MSPIGSFYIALVATVTAVLSWDFIRRGGR